MTASTTIDIEQFGSDIWDALETSGYEPGPDGFDVRAPKQEPIDHVAVIARFDDVMYGLGTPGVRRGRYYRLAGALTDAGYKHAALEIDGVPHALVVPAGDRTAAEIIAALGGDDRG